MATSKIKQPRRVVQSTSSLLGWSLLVSRPRADVYTIRKPTNHNAPKPKSKRIIENQCVGASSETASQDEKKPELAFRIRPIRRKLRSKNAKISLRYHLFANIFQTAKPSLFLIGSAPTKLILPHPMVISQACFAPPITAIC